MIMKAVNDLLNKNKNNEMVLETNSMSLTVQEMNIIENYIRQQNNEKITISNVYLWR